MTFFHEYLTLCIGLMLLLCAFAILAFPPKFGNQFYGVRTNWTLKNSIIWEEGQKLFSYSIFGIGFIFTILGSLKLQDKVPDFAFVLLIFALWKISKYSVHKILSKKFSA